jgi:hypothetical protein
MTPEQFVVAVLTYNGPLAPLNPSFGITMTSAELITLVEQQPLRMLNVCNADGFAKRVAVARAAKLQAAIVSPNIPVLSKLLSSTAAPSWKSATMYYINGDVYTVVDQQVSAVWNPPPGDLVISDTVLERAWVTLDRLASLIDVSACVALSLYTGMHAAQGGRIVAGSLGMKKGRSRVWVLGEPTYTTVAQFSKDCHVWCEDEAGSVWDVYSIMMGLLAAHYQTDVSLPHDKVVIMRGHSKARMIQLGLFYKAAPDHLQRAILNDQLEKCAQKLNNMPTSTADGIIQHGVFDDYVLSSSPSSRLAAFTTL